ncbi:MAG: alpha/beta hydrolase [Candidatus Lernaella stagnicola]|nr:alpha/beta hydrolase [Candidatus Lernaella stagnicola]
MLRRENTEFGQIAWRMFREDGAGTPLIFLHGAGGRKEIWGLVCRRMERAAVDHPLVLVDLPGHGQSPLPGRADIEEYATAVSALITAQGWPAVALAGHSMGGAISQVLAAREPSRVTHLFLVATGARIPVAPILLDLLPDQHEAVTTLFKEWGFGPDAPALLVNQAMTPFAQGDPVVIRDDLAACRDWNGADRLASITAKTLVVAGELDRMIQSKYTTFLAENIGDAQLVTLPQTGHMVPVERDRELAERFASFLAE